MPSPQLNRLLWIAMLSVLAVLVYTFDVGVFLGSGRLAVEVDPADPRTVHLRWRGEIEPPMLASLTRAIEEHRDSADRFVLSLSSPGGSVAHGGAVIRLLRDIRRTHRLETVLEGSNVCASMCVPVYLQGEVRRASGRSRWLFHEVRRHDVLKDGPEDTRPEVRRALTDKLFDTYFVPAGIPPGWIRDIRGQMQGGTDVWRTGAQLIEQQAGIVLERL